MKRFLTVVGLLTVAANPTFAQSYCQCWGSGNVVALPALVQQDGRAGANAAFAQAPQKFRKHTNHEAVVDPYNPTANGTGSAGYNWMLEQY